MPNKVYFYICHVTPKESCIQLIMVNKIFKWVVFKELKWNKPLLNTGFIISCRPKSMLIIVDLTFKNKYHNKVVRSNNNLDHVIHNTQGFNGV